MSAPAEPLRRPERWHVEPIFAGRTVAVLASGPSLTRADAQAVHAAGWPIVAVNNALQAAPFADVHYWTDVRWYWWYGQARWYRDFQGICACMEAWDIVERDPRLRPLINHHREGLSFVPGRICNGASSGYAAINLALQLGARRVVLLGFDMKPDDTGRTHFHEAHPTPTRPEVYGLMLKYFPTMTGELKARGLEVINATPNSALTTFPQRTLSDLIHAYRLPDAEDRA